MLGCHDPAFDTKNWRYIAGLFADALSGGRERGENWRHKEKLSADCGCETGLRAISESGGGPAVQGAGRCLVTYEMRAVSWNAPTPSLHPGEGNVIRSPASPPGNIVRTVGNLWGGQFQGSTSFENSSLGSVTLKKRSSISLITTTGFCRSISGPSRWYCQKKSASPN